MISEGNVTVKWYGSDPAHRDVPLHVHTRYEMSGGSPPNPKPSKPLPPSKKPKK